MCPQIFVPLITKFASTAIGKAVLTAGAGALASRVMAPKRQPQPQQAPVIIPKQNTTYQRQQGPAAAAALDDENIRPQDEDIMVAQNKKARKKLDRTRKGVKGLGAVEAPTESAPLGINPGSYA